MGYLTEKFSKKNDRMPYGIFKGVKITDLPESYLCWMEKVGYPEGEVGVIMKFVNQIRKNRKKKWACAK